jgi:hypothetical protein
LTAYFIGQSSSLDQSVTKLVQDARLRRRRLDCRIEPPATRRVSGVASAGPLELSDGLLHRHGCRLAKAFELTQCDRTPASILRDHLLELVEELIVSDNHLREALGAKDLYPARVESSGRISHPLPEHGRRKLAWKLR